MSVELKCRSYYSFLRGGSAPEELIRETSRLEIEAIAMTDLHGVYGIAKAWKEILELKRENEEMNTGHFIPKLLCGAELVLKEEEQVFPVEKKKAHPSVVMIARDRAAYGAMCRIFTEAHGCGSDLESVTAAVAATATENQTDADADASAAAETVTATVTVTETVPKPAREKGDPFLSPQRFLKLMKGPESWNQGYYPRTRGLFLFPQWESLWISYDFWADEERSLQALVKAFDWVKNFTTDQVFIPLSRQIDGRDEIRTALAKALARELGPGPDHPLKIIAHNDIHYHEPRRRAVQDVLTCIREGTTLQEAGFLLQSNTEKHLKAPAVMERLFHDVPEAIENAREIAAACTFLPSELRYRYPSEWIPEGHNGQSYLEALCRAGTEERYPRGSKEYPDGAPEEVRKQLAHELSLIAQLQFADYFLTVYDIVKYARDQGILCQGRGSAANSIVCYVLGITAIDPVRMNLLFERFISVERGEPPDIDVDFEHERREEVIQYIYRKYGRNRAAMVSAVVTYQRRSALRETAKALGLPVGTLSARKVERELLADPQIPAELKAKIHGVAEMMEDFPRHLSIHSGGFTLSADPITEIVPVEPATMEGRTIIQWDKYDLDVLGLLKIDVLALGMLTAMKKCLDLTGMQLHEIPAEDKATYAMIQKADTVGTFQIESRAQMAMLPRLKPACFYDLVIEVALVRPGPIVGRMVHPYLKRRRGEEKWELPDARLYPILGRTMGVPIFQEQVMKMAVALAGFTPGEADRLRRAIGAWRARGSIDVMGRRLMEGLMREGIPRSFADTIFDQIQGFSQYGFPESHSASFALIAYASCYLKCHHPAEFLTAMLNSQPLGFYAPHTLVDDAKRHGVKVLPLSLHESQWETRYLGDQTVRIGFHQVHGMSEEEYRSLERVRATLRKEGRKFESLHEVASKTVIRSNVLRTLAAGDGFRELGLNQREALWQLLSLEIGWRTGRAGLTEQSEADRTTCGPQKQLSLFASSEVTHDLFSPVPIEPMDGYEEVLSDYKALRLSHRTHPMHFVREKLKHRLPDMNTRRAREQPNGKNIKVPGLSLVMQRPPTAHGTAFATLEDEFGFLDLIIRKEVYQRIKDTVVEEPFVIVKGQIQRDGGAVSLLVRGVESFIDRADDRVRISHETSSLNEVRLPDTPGSIARRFI